VIKFEGCYHGHADSFLVAAGSGVITLGLPDSPGARPRSAPEPRPNTSPTTPRPPNPAPSQPAEHLPNPVPSQPAPCQPAPS